jgi:hypothetical protein
MIDDGHLSGGTAGVRSSIRDSELASNIRTAPPANPGRRRIRRDRYHSMLAVTQKNDPRRSASLESCFASPIRII